jgi:hypothetical protein
MTWRAISINKEIYNKAIDAPEEIKKMGVVKIKLFLPPSDVPNCVISEHDRKNGIFKIKFQYVIQEKGRYLFSNDQASLLIGEQSGKPIVIEIKKIDEDKINEIHLTNFIRKDLEKFIADNIGGIQDLRQKTNIERTKEFLESQASDLVKATA